MAEFVGLADSHPLLAVVLLLISAVGGVLHDWINHRTIVRHEAEATRRVQLAVDGTNSTERAAVVHACAELEAASHPMTPSRRRQQSEAVSMSDLNDRAVAGPADTFRMARPVNGHQNG